MADPKKVSDLGELTLPVALDDDVLVARGDTVYRTPKSTLVTPRSRIELNIPQSSDFGIWVNQDSATVTDVDDGIQVNKPGSTGDSVSCRVRSLPSTSAFDVQLGVTRGIPFKNYLTCGLVLRESGSGKLQTIGFDRPGRGFTGWNYWDSPTSFGDAIQNWDSWDGMQFFRAVLASGTLHALFSVDGVTWIEYIPAGISLTAHFTTAANQWGFFTCSNNQSSPNFDANMGVWHWKE